MTKKQVWRYNCDFCGKKKYSSSAMKRHEEACTANPNRKCGMHGYGMMDPQRPMPELIAALKSCPLEIDYNSDQEANNSPYKNIDALRDLASGCPACILAALRQSGCVGAVGSATFDYQKEHEEFWQQVREDQQGR